jgi:hypothetical protein
VKSGSLPSRQTYLKTLALNTNYVNQIKILKDESKELPFSNELFVDTCFDLEKAIREAQRQAADYKSNGISLLRKHEAILALIIECHAGTVQEIRALRQENDNLGTLLGIQSVQPHKKSYVLTNDVVLTF